MKNPLKEILNELDWTVQDLANASNLSYSSTYHNIRGDTHNLNEKILLVLEQKGYDTETVLGDYETFKRERREALLET